MIRRAETADIPAIAETYARLLAHERDHGGFSNWQAGVYPTAAVPEAAVPAGSMYVLEEGGNIAASMVLNQDQAPEYRDIPWAYPAEEAQVLVIHTLCVPPEQAGRGFGSRMIRFAIAEAERRRMSVLRIDTYARNEPAKALYRKHGFRIAGYHDTLHMGLIQETLVYLEYRVQSDPA